MKNIYTIIAFAILTFLTLIPPIDFFFRNPFTDKWFLLILICGFAGFYTLFIKTNWIVRVLAIGSFFQCFTSMAPFISFTSYVSIILCCYLYIICTRIENWDIIFKCLQTILFLNIFMLFVQTIGKDSLLNWRASEIEHFGIIGQHMQMASFAAIISAVLISFNPLNLIFAICIALFCKSVWGVLVAGIGFTTLLIFRSPKWAAALTIFTIVLFVGIGIKEQKFTSNFSEFGRYQTWKKTIQGANQHPWVGWGAGTYKFIFPQISSVKYKNMFWKNAHNFITELLFEVGYLTTGFILICLIVLGYKIFKAKEVLLLSGLFIMVFDGLVHFPDRMTQCVPLIILFLAYCEVKLWTQTKTSYVLPI